VDANMFLSELFILPSWQVNRYPGKDYPKGRPPDSTTSFMRFSGLCYARGGERGLPDAKQISPGQDFDEHSSNNLHEGLAEVSTSVTMIAHNFTVSGIIVVVADAVKP
jgi:hypothetical protein